MTKITNRKKRIWSQPLEVMVRSLPVGAGPSTDTRTAQCTPRLEVCFQA
jgi:hypothetical protein